MKLEINRASYVSANGTVDGMNVDHKVSYRICFDDSLSGSSKEPYEIANYDGEIVVRRMTSNQTSMFD